jgi:hypothetical protein
MRSNRALTRAVGGRKLNGDKKSESAGYEDARRRSGAR